MCTYGYVRVSTQEQNEDHQLAAMSNLSEEMVIFVDKQSGKDFNRPKYQEMVGKLQKGDLLYVASIDRLGRNYDEMQQQWRILTKDIGIDVCVMDMPLLDTRQSKDLLGTFVADLVLQVLSFAAHNERDNIRKRQAEGIAAAKARGVQFGRPPRDPPEGFVRQLPAYRSGKITRRELQKQYKICATTFFNWCKKVERSRVAN